MIVQESDLLLAALDRRLQVDRVLAIDPLAAVSRSSGSPLSAARGAPPSPTTARSGEANDVSDLVRRLPLGGTITARVVEVPRPDHVVAEVDALRIALAWPKGNGVAPQPGRDIALRVLAHTPMLLFESVPDAPAGSAQDEHGDPLTRWSSDVLRMQSTAAASRGAGPTRFDAPILDIEVVPLHEAVAMPNRQSTAERASNGIVGFETTAVLPAIDLDSVIVARSTALVDGVDSPLIPRAPDDGARTPTAFVPLVLQGPAWPGQPLELVVRREREDEQLDNPVLDQWCGEVVIDLPHLGRVAGHLTFSMQGLKIRLEGDDEATVDAMHANAADLAHAFAAADLRVNGLSVADPPPTTGGRRGTRTDLPAMADEADDAPRVAAALRYRGGNSTPVVTAKGRGPVADEIVRRAADHGVAIHVSNNLAAMLMQVDIDRAIPPQLFQAVAQLLAWLYRLEGRSAPRETP